jgi:hypothetical protein
MLDVRSSASDLPAMVPTDRTTWMRRFLPWQLLRFVLINLRMLRMIRLSHPHQLPPT